MCVKMYSWSFGGGEGGGGGGGGGVYIGLYMDDFAYFIKSDNMEQQLFNNLSINIQVNW